MDSITKLTPDLSGTNELYREVGEITNVHRLDQKIRFNCTVFAKSIEVYDLSGAVVSKLELGKDYTIPDWAYEDEDKSTAKMLQRSFDDDLVSAIVMLKPLTMGESYNVEIQYQRFYPKQLRSAIKESGEFNITGELLYELVREVEYLKSTKMSVGDVNSIVDPGYLLLPADPSGSNPNNFIEKETHVVNVPGSRFVIHPKGGSFFKDNKVKVYHPGTNKVLTQGVDYHVFGMDEGKTKVAETTYGVYKFIILVTNLVDEVEIDYQAYGGEPTIDNYEVLHNKINSLIMFLESIEFMTNANLGRTEIMMSLYERMEKTEAHVRRLMETPSYGDLTHGSTTLMKLFADTVGLHWYTIASLFTVDGNSIPCKADTFMFRFQSQQSHIQFTVSVSVDLYNTHGNCLNVNVVAENYPKGYIPFTDYTQLANIIRPMFRLVWNESMSGTGAYLQLGFNLINMVEEIVVLHDMSGRESAWKMVAPISSSTLPQDDNFLLPDDKSIWSSALSSSHEERVVIPYKGGHLVWSGDVVMNEDEGWSVLEIGSDQHVMEDEADHTRFTKVRVGIEEDSGLTYAIDVHFNPGAQVLKGHATFTHQDKPAYVNVEIYREPEGTITFRVNYDISAGTTSNRLHVRDLVVYG